MRQNNEFLGKGWKFPVEVNRVSGAFEDASYEDSIAQSVRIILGTARGERVMRPEFGCGLKSYAFTQMSYTVLSEIERDVQSSLGAWEPRITDIEVKCHADGAVLYVDVSYVVRSTNSTYNLVYPFYLNEGA